MESYKQLIVEKNLSQLFVFGMYRSGTTAIARLLSSENKIAFSSDPIRPFFNWYRTKLQKNIGCKEIEDHTRPLGDYFQGDMNYIKKLRDASFQEKFEQSEMINIRKNLIKHGLVYSPKFIDSLKLSTNLSSLTYADEFKYYLGLIAKTYGGKDTCLVGLKEVWSIEMAFPIINLIGKCAKILIVLRDPLDVVASSFSGSDNYCILSLVRQWRKQIVFYNFLKQLFPNQVTCINYEEFCSKPEILKEKIKNLIKNSDSFFSDNLNLSDDYGNAWIKNSSYKDAKLSSSIDNKSVGKYKKVLTDSEIEWIVYLTHLNSYKKYNRSNEIPSKPSSFYPKKNINNVSDWSKIDIINLEGKNLDQQLQLEHNRIKKIYQSKNQNLFDESMLISQT